MRRSDWLARLTATVDAWRDRPFRYGESDCARFGAECVEAMTGQRFALPHAGRRDALRLMRSVGLESLISARLGPPSPGLPARGDVCLVQTDDGPGIGVSVGAEIAIPATDGLGFHPLTCALRRWRI